MSGTICRCFVNVKEKKANPILFAAGSSIALLILIVISRARRTKRTHLHVAPLGLGTVGGAQTGEKKIDEQEEIKIPRTPRALCFPGGVRACVRACVRA